MKKIKHIFLVLMMAISMIFAIGCRQELPPFEFSEEVPTQMGITDEIYFRNYLEDNDEAEYKLFVSYFDAINNVQVTEREQSSMIFVLEQEGEYTFKIERDLNGKKQYLTCTVTVLPDAPKFEESVVAIARKGAIRTFGEIFTACQCVVTPGNLEQKLKFLSYDFVSVVEGVDDQMGVAIDDTATVDTDFTFVNEGVYTFTVKAENVSGSAETTISVNAFDKDNVTKKVELSYDPELKVLSWDAIEEATAYRVWIDDKAYVDVTETSFSFDNAQTYPDKEYIVKIAPVFTDTVYKGTTITKPLPVGRVHSKLTLTKDMDIVSWNERYFVESYTVIEGDEETVLDADTLSYALKGAYATDSEVEVKVYATFDDGTVTETATTTVVTGELGSVTFKKINATNGVAENVEWVAFDMEEASDVWFLSEFVGQNAPNYGIQVMNLTSEWDGSYTIKRDNPANKLGVEYTPGGMLLCNSSENAWTNINLYRGYNTNGANGTRGSVNDGKNVGLYRYQANVHYIQIVGYEIVEGSENKSARLTAYLFTVDEEGGLTLVNKSSGDATWSTHVLGGTYATYFGNIAVTLEKQGPESITFGYAKPAKTLSSLLYNITAGYEYREQLIALCEVTEPSAEENFVPQRVLGERYHDGRVIEDDKDEEEGDDGEVDLTGKKLTLNGEATFDRAQAINGIATDVDYVKFEGFDGDVWFMTQFKGKNAPNYAVHAEDAFATWDAKVATTPSASNWNDYKYFPAGTLLTNSSEKSWIGLSVFRGTNTNTAAGADSRGNIAGNTAGMYRFADGVEYIQIIGYNYTSGQISCYVFQVNESNLILLAKEDVVIAHSNGSLKGSVAVLYPNIGVTPSGSGDTYTAQGPTSISFTYAQPATSLYELVNGLDKDYAFTSQIIKLLDVKAPEEEGGNEGGNEGGEATVAGLTEVTMDRVNAIAGAATNVDYVKFEGFAGDVWFLTQFKGKNAPNYAVHAEDAFATWDAKALAQPGAANWATTEHPSDGVNYFNYFPGGTLIANSSERSWTSVSVWRGLNTNYGYSANGRDGDRRGLVGDNNKVGFYRYDDNKEYVQIIGYTYATGTISCYVYEVNANGTLTVVDKVDTVVGHSNGALKGSVAVIYPNIGVTPTMTNGVYSAQGAEQITFSYAQPSETLAGLVNGLAEGYALKAALKTELAIS